MLRKRAVCQLRQVKSKKQSAWRLYLVNEGKSSFEPVWVAALAALPTVRSKMTHAAEKRRELTSEAMKRQRTGAMIMMTEKLLWQESELKTPRQQLDRSSKILEQLKLWEWQQDSPNRHFRRWWLRLETVWAILQVPTIGRIGKMRIMQRPSRASWAMLTNQAGWWAQSTIQYSRAWRDFGGSRWSLTNWCKQNEGM